MWRDTLYHHAHPEILVLKYKYIVKFIQVKIQVKIVSLKKTYLDQEREITFWSTKLRVRFCGAEGGFVQMELFSSLLKQFNFYQMSVEI